MLPTNVLGEGAGFDPTVAVFPWNFKESLIKGEFKK